MPRFGVAAFVAVALALPLWAAAGTDAPPKRPGGKLVLSLLGPERIAVVDLRSGKVVQRRVPGGTLCHGDVIASGGRIVIAGSEKRRAVAKSIGLDLRGPARTVAEAHLFASSAVNGRLWIATVRNGRRWMSFSSLREVTLDGRTTFTGRPPPPGGGMMGVLADDLLVEKGGTLKVWDPRRGRITRRLPGAFPVAAHDRRLAWCRGRCRTLHLSDPERESTIDPPGAVAFQGDGAFSRDGRLLAVGFGGTWPGRLALVDVRRRSVALVPGGRLGDYDAFGWSPDGRWLYFVNRRGRLMAYRPGTERPVQLPVRLRGTVVSVAAAR